MIMSLSAGTVSLKLAVLLQRVYHLAFTYFLIIKRFKDSLFIEKKCTIYATASPKDLIMPWKVWVFQRSGF